MKMHTQIKVFLVHIVSVFMQCTKIIKYKYKYKYKSSVHRLTRF